MNKLKVLIISHNPFGKINNMGKTLLNYFSDFESHELAQFYIQNVLPTEKTCSQYYRFTDMDAIKSIFLVGRDGKKYGSKDLHEAPTDNGINRLNKITSMIGSKRNGITYLLRNFIWKCSKWFSMDLKKWLVELNPDIVFFASGDYSFMYEIALKISVYLNKPLIVSCMDDYYLYNKNNNTILGRIEHYFRMNIVKKTLNYSECILTISDMMTDTYANFFKKKCYTLYASTEVQKEEIHANHTLKISYLGNLGLNRYQQLLKIGQCLKTINNDGQSLVLDVYSSEKDEKIIKELSKEKGIAFHGEVSYEDVVRIMKESSIIVYVESFDDVYSQVVKYSMSTKIADSLMNGPCLLAYGPRNIASIEYLINNQCAYIITEGCDLHGELVKVLTDEKMRNEIIAKARLVAHKNHDIKKNGEKLRNIFLDIIDKKCMFNQ